MRQLLAQVQAKRARQQLRTKEFTINGLQTPFQTLIDRPGPGRDRTGGGRVCQTHWIVIRPFGDGERGKGSPHEALFGSWGNCGGKSILVSRR